MVSVDLNASNEGAGDRSKETTIEAKSAPVNPVAKFMSKMTKVQSVKEDSQGTSLIGALDQPAIKISKLGSMRDSSSLQGEGV